MPNPEQITRPEPGSVAPADDATAETRRQALRRLGKYAAYTAPALLAMLTEAKAQFCSTC